LKNKKKLVYVLHDICVGGVEVALLSAIPKLNQYYDLKVVVLGKISPGLIKGLTDDEKRVFEKFDYPLYLYPFVLHKMVSAILNFNPDTMVCSLWRASLVGVMVKFINKNIRFFSFNHSTHFPHKFASFFTRAASRMADVILTDGVATKIFIEKELNPKVPVRTVSFLTHRTPETVYKNVPQNGYVNFMFLGRINKVKNLPMVIEVIKHLTDMSIPAKLDVYGRNDGNKEETEALVAAYGLHDVITFKGEVDVAQRTSLFPRYDFYIQLSSFEGMAMSVAEAMQHGLVPVLSPVGEIIHYAKDMESAIFINVADKDTWRNDLDKVSSVIQDKALYAYLARNCHQQFLNKPMYADSLIQELERL
jgi:glycosyltransferase involved in cell wall biosynthesis